MSILFLFLDGVGLGGPDEAVNPLGAARMPFLRSILGGPLTLGLVSDPQRSDDGVLFRELDPTLGHPGLPQSATGQATLLTGINGADLMGGHYGPWPGPTLRKLLEEGSLFSFAGGPGHAALANAYPPGYFEWLEKGRARVNVPVQAALSAGLELRGLDSYARGEAVAADLTGAYFGEFDRGLAAMEPQEAGSRLSRLAARHRFTFFDLWLTDRIGHRGSFEEAVALAESLDRFLAGVVASLERVTLLVTSDHGNFEDKSTRGHTRAPVPLISLGPGRDVFATCRRLEDVAPAVRTLLAQD